MKRVAFVIPLLGLLAGPALADFFVAGDFNGWNAAGTAMTDMGGGVWSVDVALGASEWHEFKVTQGDWGWSVPGSGNSWLVTDGAGNVTVKIDTNAAGDGWLPDQYRIGVNTEPGAWTAVGNWQGWDNGNAATAMAPLGGGIYYYAQTIPAGSYEYKAVQTGTWNAIGADSRGVNAATVLFDTTAGNDYVEMWVDAYNGAVKVSVTPEPASLLCLLAGALLLRRR